MTKYPTYNKDSHLELEFEEYTERHYDSWVEFARHKKYGKNVQPVLVYGFDMTRDFEMVAYSYERTSRKGQMTFTVPTLASASASARVTWNARPSPHTNYGPQQLDPPPRQRAIDSSSPQPSDTSVSDEFNQCVFVRYYTMRPRIEPLGLFPKIIKAGAGPHDLGSGDDKGEAFPELMVQSDAETTTSGDEDLGGEWGPTTDDIDSKPLTVVRNTPYVRFLPCHFIHADFSPQDEEYDSWGPIADYVFQVIPFPSSPLGHSTLSMEELRCGFCIDEPPGFGGDPQGNKIKHISSGRSFLGRWGIRMTYPRY